MIKILIIEDNEQIVEAISLTFQIRWPEAVLLSTPFGEKGVEMVGTESPDLVVLDLGLPDIHGFTVLKEIRLFSAVPVLILTVMAEEADIVRGLEYGADDYVVKPFRQLEFLARVQNLLRRQGDTEYAPALSYGRLRIDVSQRKLRLGERTVSLTATEAQVVYQLMKQAGYVLSTDELVRRSGATMSRCRQEPEGPRSAVERDAGEGSQQSGYPLTKREWATI
jgi:two-component system KDP operon response regulator KdpE